MLISVPFDLGEQEAITLAEKIGANLIILDERDARQMAWQRGLNVIGLLGVLGMVFPKWDVPYCLLPIAYCLLPYYSVAVLTTQMETRSLMRLL
jgi:hypothetical protein